MATGIPACCARSIPYHSVHGAGDHVMKNLLSFGFACIGWVAGVSSVYAEGGPNTSPLTAYALWADGVAASDVIPPTTGLGTEGTPQWFWFAVSARRSYSLEIFQLREVGYEGAAMA